MYEETNLELWENSHGVVFHFFNNCLLIISASEAELGVCYTALITEMWPQPGMFKGFSEAVANNSKRKYFMI